MAVIFQRTNPYSSPQTFQLKREDFMETSEGLCLSGNIVDMEQQECYSGRLHIADGRIVRIERGPVPETHYILPGFIDAHVHIESSMLTPSAFAREAVKHGVVAAVADPHEIANVMGIEGIDFMIADAAQSGFKFFFGVPSCVPASSFETSGAVLDVAAVEQLLQRDDLYFLAEMMNYPGVVQDDPEVWNKIAAAHRHGKPIDGHAPALSGDDLKKYLRAGISTDHECEDICEAEEKLNLGMKVIIREGSAARRFDQLYPLINSYPSSVMICTDDCGVHDLQRGVFPDLFKRGLAKNLHLFNLLQAFSWNPVNHYALPVGLLRLNDFADCIVVDSLEHFSILQTYINGKKVYDRDRPTAGEPDGALSSGNHKPRVINHFKASEITHSQLEAPVAGDGQVRVIEVFDKSLYTKTRLVPQSLLVSPGTKTLTSNTGADILKVIVLSRYEKAATPAIGFVHGFGLQSGALCTSIAHDSHNIIAVGVDDADLVHAMNTVIRNKGGIACGNEASSVFLPLPVAGLMSTEPVEAVARQYDALLRQAKTQACRLTSPFMTLSFLSLIVIPELKIFTGGLFDVSAFTPVDLLA
ncbi:MAG: adenine deaminase [Prevotellaceae bacterium]|jgi:adenine deaminase|nr:adenine deaminase [Prevotellaceae bacterium]